MLSVLMNKIDTMQEWILSLRREMEILRKNQNKVLKIKNTVIKMKKVFDGLINRLNVTEKRVSDLEDRFLHEITPKTTKASPNYLDLPYVIFYMDNLFYAQSQRVCGIIDAKLQPCNQRLQTQRLGLQKYMPTYTYI